jgi:tripartite-type tricarboxylate transporter receptor subunit TctC
MSRSIRRKLGLRVALAGLLLSFAGWSLPARALDYPVRQITLIVPSPPGGGTDTSWRIIEPKLSAILGQKIVIENRPGASGNIGAAAAAQARNDGYTLLALISSHVINPSLMKEVGYNLERDFAPISRTIMVPGVLVGHPSIPAKDLNELIAYAKANPGKLDFGSAGVGSMSQLMIELLLKDAGVKMTHVPYKGTAPAFNDVLAGHVALMSADIMNVVPHIAAGSVRAFGVTSKERAKVAPDIPTIAEAGIPGYEAIQWFGLVAPAGTPREIIQLLHRGVVQALEDPVIKKRFTDDGGIPMPSASPEEFAEFIRAEGAKWAKLIKDGGIGAQQ